MHVFEDDFAVAPDAISLTKLLEIVAVEAGNGRAGLRDAERVMDIMRRKGVVPSRISWNVVLSVVVRYAELEEDAMTQADRVLETMTGEGFAPDSFTVAHYCNCARLTKIAGEREQAEHNSAMVGRTRRAQGDFGASARARLSWEDEDYDPFSSEDNERVVRVEGVGTWTHDDEEDMYGLESPYMQSFGYHDDMSRLSALDDEDYEAEPQVKGSSGSLGEEECGGEWHGDAQQAAVRHEVDGPDEMQELVGPDHLRGWSAEGFKSIRGSFDYTYVPEEDGGEEVFELRSSSGETGLVRETRETYVLKAWRLFRGLPEQQRSTAVYAAMMDAFGCIGRATEARGLLDLASSHGLTADQLMFNAALRCCRHQEEIAQVLFRGHIFRSLGAARQYTRVGLAKVAGFSLRHTGAPTANSQLTANCRYVCRSRHS